jgi:DNA-binding XRE family transcriptional regulator
MPLTLPAPPELGPDFWDQPEILAAVEHEHLGAFLLAYRGARRARWSQDQIARWIGRSQGTISTIESGRMRVSPGQVYGILESLKVPPRVVMAWGTG